jgi:hypothetical protein
MPKDDVWVIPDPWEKPSSVIKKKPKKIPEAKPKERGRSPATALSLSLFLWGAGQIYNGQRELGFLFLLVMANFYTLLSMIWLHWEVLFSFLGKFQITPFEVLITGGLFFFCGLLFWFIVALHAYYTSQGRSPSIGGEERSMIPPLCSFVIPGWGQFLNGQSKKGIFFFVLTIPGLLALSALVTIPRLWPSVESASERLFLEKILMITALTMPVFLLTWIIGIYDAGRVSLDPDKKERLWNRMKYAVNRLRMKGWGRGVLPRLEMILMLVLFLTFFVAYSYYYFPKKFYTDRLESLQTTLSEQGMVLIPNVIGQALYVISPD